jgi:DNA invertase Pin-like site-specific DNA recombinase
MDASSPSGEMLANVLAVFAQFERRLIGERTKEALAVRRNQGVRLGRPRVIPPEVRAEIIDARHQGLTFQSIADQLNELGVPTGHGGRQWYAATVRRVVRVA